METLDDLLQELDSRSKKSVVTSTWQGGRAEGIDEAADLVRRFAHKVRGALAALSPRNSKDSRVVSRIVGEKRRRTPVRYKDIPLEALDPILEMLAPRGADWTHIAKIEAWLEGRGIVQSPGTLEHILYNGVKDRRIECNGLVYRIRQAPPTPN